MADDDDNNRGPLAEVFGTLWRRAPGLFVRGVGMGAADVVPGVSGGTMALITGIYDELVATIAGIDRAFVAALLRLRLVEVLQRANASFLVPLLAGILSAIFALAKGITWLLEVHPTPSWGALTGLIAASTIVVARHVRGWGVANGVAALGGAALGYLVTLLVPVHTGPEWYKFTGAGAVASIAMILPGISGSFLLVILGKYQQLLSAVTERDLATLATFGVGFLAGILGFARVLRWLLAHAHEVTMAFLVGLMAGSMRKVWPFRRVLDADGGAFDCTLPETWDATALLAFAMMAAAIVVVLAIERLAARAAR